MDQSVFEIPDSYHVQDNGRNVHLQDEDYEIMQFAIQQSLLESSRSQVHLAEQTAGHRRLTVSHRRGIFTVFTEMLFSALGLSQKLLLRHHVHSPSQQHSQDVSRQTFLLLRFTHAAHSHIFFGLCCLTC